MPIPTRTTLDTLVEEGPWLRRLARGLVRDPHLAEDAVQETLVAAVERAPDAGPSRGWLARVLRNALHQERRGRGRRAAREALVVAARARSSPAAADTAARLSIQRRVLEVVEGLEEPYRTAIVLRYLDGLPPREVARRTGAPVKTVHTRLERGLAKLRARLDATSGGRTAWLGALVPLGLGRRTIPLWTLGLGAAVMDAKLKWAGGVAAAALAGAFLHTSLRTPALEPPPVLAEAPRAAELVEDIAPVLVEEPVPVRVATERESVALPAPTPEAEPAASAMPATLTGRVLDANGSPVGGLTVTYRASGSAGEPAVDEPTAHSAANGRFELPLAEHGHELVVQSEEWITVGAPVVSTGRAPEQEPVITVAPRRDYAGVVVDEEGLPIEGATLAVVMRDSVRHEIVGRYVTYATHQPLQESGERGEFAFEPVGWTEGSYVLVQRAGYADLRAPLPPSSDPGLRFVLPDLEDTAQVLRGHVLDRRGEPVADAWVSCGMSATKSEEGGVFALELMQGEEPDAIRAAKRGLLPAVLPLGPREEWPASIELVVGEPSLELTGTVVDERGEPVPNALVWLLDKTEFGFLPLEMNGERFSVQRSLEELVSPGADRIGSIEAEADARGRFRLQGLLARSYRVVAVHPGTLAATPPRSFEAGARDVRLVLPLASVLERVAGRVLSLAGDPLEGVEVRAKREIRHGGERLGEKEREPSVVTDAEGRFAFEDLVTDGLVLLLDGPLISRSQEAPELGADLEDLELRVAAKRYFRVELGDPSLASYVAMHDATDRALVLTTHEANLSLAAERFHLDEGRSAVLEVDESAAFLVLFDAEREEVQRVPIRLEPSLDVQVIRL